MQRLIDGIHHFQREVFPAKRDLFASLATGQRPHSLIITCSDSRIDPFLLTHADPGEIFVVRNAGNTIPDAKTTNGGESATIEYAVRVLKVATIVVCGHSHCGAMAALLDPSLTDKLPAVRDWLTAAEHIREDIETHGLRPSERNDSEAVVKRNVILQMSNLKTYDFVDHACRNGKLNIMGWFYRFETGEVEGIEFGQQDFHLI
ncbi:MAG: carbonic anhydrase [Phycisphaerales bacterium]|nr:carbonic anhydrase [Phycisphaerales bacterium]MCB9856479.1 carbonic anhydrase [Phycisphaerales bacterium]MCB9863960.1 carbonic anhydrase [Phycisphaerales bacterium]